MTTAPVRAWPVDPDELISLQKDIARMSAPLWVPPERVLLAACFVCFARGSPDQSEVGERGWAAAALARDRKFVADATVVGTTRAPYTSGLLALREGTLLDAAATALPETPEVLLVNATGRDHPRRAGLAVHLGVVLDVPTIGVTHRPLHAAGEWPPDERWATSPLMLDGERVGCWMRTRRGARPIAVHAGWRTDVDTAVGVVRRTIKRSRTPDSLRRARRAARLSRAGFRRPDRVLD